MKEWRRTPLTGHNGAALKSHGHACQHRRPSGPSGGLSSRAALLGPPERAAWEDDRTAGHRRGAWREGGRQAMQRKRTGGRSACRRTRTGAPYGKRSPGGLACCILWRLTTQGGEAATTPGVPASIRRAGSEALACEQRCLSEEEGGHELRAWPRLMQHSSLAGRGCRALLAAHTYRRAGSFP